MLSRLTVNEWKLLEKMASLLVQERIDNKVFIAKFEEGSTEPTPTPEQPTPDGYNDNDYQKLVTFLELVDENGVKNGEKLSENYDPQDPATWKGTTWENGRIKKIYFSYEKCVGKLDVSDCTMLERL